MDTIDTNKVQAWAMAGLAYAVAEFRDGQAGFGAAAARYELAVQAGNDPAALDRFVLSVLNHKPEICMDHMAVYTLPLSVRVQNRLVSEGFDTLGKMKALTVRRVLSMPMMGRRGLREIQEVLAAHNVEMLPGTWSYMSNN